jgi:hypothetical protein
MGKSQGTYRLEEHVRQLAAADLSAGAPPEVAEYAARATMARLGRERPRGGLERRAAAYYGAVVRRRLVSRYPGTTAAARVVVDAVVADLFDAGRTGRDVWDEISRAWTDVMPAELIEEYRQRLCA